MNGHKDRARIHYMEVPAACIVNFSGEDGLPGIACGDPVMPGRSPGEWIQPAAMMASLHVQRFGPHRIPCRARARQSVKPPITHFIIPSYVESVRRRNAMGFEASVTQGQRRAT